MYFRILLISLFGLSCLCLQAQESGMPFKGKLINKNTKEPIPNAHIIILNRNVGLSSNIDGEFRLLTQLNDSLRISAIGYENDLYVITTVTDLEHQHLIELIPEVYELAEVEITPYLSYAELRDAIVNYKPSEEELQYIQIRDHLKEILKYKEPSGEYGLKLSGPVSMLYNAFSKYAKSQRKLKRFKLEDKRQAIISHKYNFQIVSRLIESDEEAHVKAFMAFCNFPEEYLLEVADIDLYKNILINYKVFMANKTLN